MKRTLEEVMAPLLRDLEAAIADLSDEDRIWAVNAFTRAIHKASAHAHMPVGGIQWVPLDLVEANDYNPNAVAKNEMRLLHTSIAHDGYTQPVVTVWDEARGKYVIIDGFHRYLTARNSRDIREATLGYLPVVVLDKPINDRMASTVRHNRARGKHSVDGMSNMVFTMLDNGWTDEAILKELGMEPEELVRLKHITGFAKLFENVEYRRAWVTKKQLQLQRKAREAMEAKPE